MKHYKTSQPVGMKEGVWVRWEIREEPRNRMNTREEERNDNQMGNDRDWIVECQNQPCLCHSVCSLRPSVLKLSIFPLSFLTFSSFISFIISISSSLSSCVYLCNNWNGQIVTKNEKQRKRRRRNRKIRQQKLRQSKKTSMKESAVAPEGLWDGCRDAEICTDWTDLRHSNWRLLWIVYKQTVSYGVSWRTGKWRIRQRHWTELSECRMCAMELWGIVGEIKNKWEMSQKGKTRKNRKFVEEQKERKKNIEVSSFERWFITDFLTRSWNVWWGNEIENWELGVESIDRNVIRRVVELQGRGMIALGRKRGRIVTPHFRHLKMEKA